MARSDRHEIIEVRPHESGLDIRWRDGHESRFPAIWLRNACSCTVCGSTESGVRHFKLTDIPENPRISAARLYNDAMIAVSWDGGHESTFDSLWLRAHCLSEEERTHRLAKPVVWGKGLGNSLPYMDYPIVAADEEQHLAFLETLRDFGFVILRDVPAEREKTEEVASLVGKLRMTNYGIFELEARPGPEIAGDMAFPLNLHTDEPYRVDPPAITLFHILAQSDHGGDSTLMDGLLLAETFRKREPEAFEILCTIPARFNRTLKEGRAFEIQAPIISRNRDGMVTGVRILDRGMAPVDVRLDQVQPFYSALRKLLTMIYAGEEMITVKLLPGEMLVFNNQRLLHGRTGFDPSKSRRHVRSCNVDLDEFHSRMRVAYRKRRREEAWMNLCYGTRL